MNSSRMWDGARSVTRITTEITDREVAAATDRRIILEGISSIIAHRIADIVWEKMEPAIREALKS